MASATLNTFAPPPERFGMSSMGMALLAHGCLIAALTWGIQWRSHPKVLTVSAELWSELPAEAAPPPPQPTEAIQAPEPIPLKAPDVVTEQQQKKAAAKKIPASIPKRQRVEDEKRHAREVEDMIAEARAASSGNAKQSSGPSASYAGKIKAKIRPNIVFQDVDSVRGNSAAEVDIRIAPDGTILLPLKLSQSSGNKAWDNAVLRAIEKTEVLPHDIDGRIPSSMTLVLRPKE